jgi:diphosphomevalonate decarboxylase
MTRVVARACTNIALVKYWGKRDVALNLPAAGSFSVTLDGLHTTTSVELAAGDDRLVLNGVEDRTALAKARPVIDRVRALSGSRAALRIQSENTFPTSAGLASSASGLAALALAAARAVGLALAPGSLSALARLGSGSACRSVFGGFVEWRAGVAPDGSDSHAFPFRPPEHWDLRCVVALVSEGAKPTGSSAGMIGTAASSPYHAAFLASVAADLEAARDAVAARDLRALGRVAERSCLRMHAAMLAGEPPLLYLRPESWAVIEEVRRLQRAGVPLFFTADAGPNLKLFCEPDAEPAVVRALDALPAVRRTLAARPGPPAAVLEEEP